MAAERHIAAFFDAENIAAAHVDLVRMDLLQRGRLLIRKAYGDFQSGSLKPWVRICKSYSIDMVSRPELAAGKNASDIAMVIDAMECLVTRTNIDMFAIISSDSDCTPLALRLREHGKFVIGFGGESSPVAFRQACDEFIVLRRLKGTTSVKRVVVVNTIESADDAVHRALRELEQRHATGEGTDGGPWVETDALLNLVSRLHKDFRSLLSSWNYGWVSFLTRNQQLELSSQASGSGYNNFVRHKHTLPSETTHSTVTPTKRKRSCNEGDGPTLKKARKEAGSNEKITCTTLKQYRAAVLKILAANGETFVHVSDITRQLRMDSELHTLVKENHASPGHYIVSMKKLEVQGKRVRLQK